jgi:dipeptidyl aminopeptidase/acylaminoacyl peptidase
MTPLEGTATTRPAPPRGVRQRRLTFTSDRPFPGVATSPRHWLRSSPDGSTIAFLMKDNSGVVQLWTVPTVGGLPRQVTTGQHPIASAFTWSPGWEGIVHGLDRSICFTDSGDGTNAPVDRGVAGSVHGTASVRLRGFTRWPQVAFTRAVVHRRDARSDLRRGSENEMNARSFNPVSARK